MTAWLKFSSHFPSVALSDTAGRSNTELGWSEKATQKLPAWIRSFLHQFQHLVSNGNQLQALQGGAGGEGCTNTQPAQRCF